MRTKAFTLIELLIVVAIIAILAAIAIPNLLEAQTRAKISRAKADIRTMVTGLQSYAVDNNAYPTYHYVNGPLHFFMGGEVTDFGVSPPFNGPSPLTSPVSYITSMPIDTYNAWTSGDPEELKQFHYVNWPYAIRSVSAEARKQSFRNAESVFGAFRIHSLGPDLEGPDAITYDPTNGTTSRGDVLYGPSSNFDVFVSLLP